MRMSAQIDFLKSIPHFSGLSLAELNSITKLVFEKTAERGETILVEGEPATALYFVTSGVVKLFKTSFEGKEQILKILRPGESFEDASVLDGGPSVASAQAMGPIALYGIRKGDIEALVRDFPQVAMNINRVLAARVRHLVSLVEDLSFRHVTARVAKILLEHAGQSPASGPRLSQQDMAAMAGTAREMIGRSLKTLEEEKAIRLEHHRIVIINSQALKEMVEAST